MAVLADVMDEFKQASPGGKALMVVAIIAVAGVGIYVYKLKNSSNTSAGTLVPIDSGGSSSGGSSSGGSSSGGSSSGTNPTGIFNIPPTKPPGSQNQGPQPPPTSTPPPTNNPQPQGVWVTVTKWGTGSWASTLWGIAQHFYGNGALWNRIAQANHISDPRKLRVGQRLFVPGAS